MGPWVLQSDFGVRDTFIFSLILLNLLRPTRTKKRKKRKIPTPNPLPTPELITVRRKAVDSKPNQHGPKLTGRMKSLGCPAHPLSVLSTQLTHCRCGFLRLQPHPSTLQDGCLLSLASSAGLVHHLSYGKSVCICWQGHDHVSFLCLVPLNIAQHPTLRELLARLANIYRESVMCKLLYYGVQVQIEVSQSRQV